MAKKTIRQAILENLASPNPKTTAELAEDLGVSIDSVYQKLSRLRRAGKIKPLPVPAHEPAPPNIEPTAIADLLREERAAIEREARAEAAREAAIRNAPPVNAAPEPAEPSDDEHIPLSLTDISAELLDKIAAEPVVSDLMRMKWMSYALRVGPWPIKLQANKILEDMGRARTGSVGPPTPLTHDDKVARLARLMLAVGEDIAREAFDTAFPKDSADGTQDTPPQDPGTPPSGATPTGGSDVG